MSSVRYWVWLSSVTAASPHARFALSEFYGDAERAFFAPSGDYRRVTGITAREAALFEKRDLSEADRIVETCAREEIKILCYADPAYPSRLKNIYASPVVLYVKGNLPDVDAIPSAAVIGTRSATVYGIRMARDIAAEIAHCGGIVVSGLTEGIDRAAAEGCLLAGGRCVGVLGTAHAKLNPLQADVVKTGALVSEYPPGTRTQNHFFRERNRVSSGLSHAVCVVEAPATSGSLLFAREALEQGREIYAVPGNADAKNSVGILELLKQGARPAARGWDVLEDLAVIYPDALHPPGAEKKTAAYSEKPRPVRRESAPKPKSPTKKEIDKENATGYIDLQERFASLSEDQRKIAEALRTGEANIDDIIETTGMPTAKVLAQLTILEIKGVIRRTGGRRVALNMKE